MEIKHTIINARKFDGRLHRSWNAELISRAGDQLLFRGIFEKEVTHKDLGTIRPGTVSFEYYWLKKWFSIFRFHEPGGEFRNYYCNINMPPTFSGDVLDFVDLDIDILVRSDWSVEVLDEDEFARNAETYGYSAELIRLVHQKVTAVRSMIHNKEFPFDRHRDPDGNT